MSLLIANGLLNQFSGTVVYKLGVSICIAESQTTYHEICNISKGEFNNYLCSKIEQVQIQNKVNGLISALLAKSQAKHNPIMVL